MEYLPNWNMEREYIVSYWGIGQVFTVYLSDCLKLFWVPN